jgi:formate hydrogenlyase subunit 6/NADH:ubiquinone oxidoreductase subunit I
MVSTVQAAVGQYFKNISNAVTSTFEGMAVTMSWMFRRPMTIQYPDKIEKPIEETLPDCYRGVLEVDTGICTGCMACQKACPIGCIRIKVGKNAETAERMLERFDIYVARCMFCGLCSEACPTGAIHHTSHFEIANDKLENLLLRYVPANPTPVYKPKKDVEPVTQPRGQAYLAARKHCTHAWRKEERHGDR